MIRVLEVDQWTSTAIRGDLSWGDLKTLGINGVSGGDSEAARVIFGGHFRFRDVEADDTPRIGDVWFIEDARGFPTIWKTQYDSSG